MKTIRGEKGSEKVEGRVFFFIFAQVRVIKTFWESGGGSLNIISPERMSFVKIHSQLPPLLYSAI